MAKQNKRWSWRSWLPDVGAAFSRFPLAVILAGLLTLDKLSTDSPGDTERKIIGTLAASFLWVPKGTPIRASRPMASPSSAI